METKICTKCGEKDISEFHFRKDTKTYRKICRSCHNNKANEYKRNNKIIKSKKDKAYYEAHKQERLTYRKKYYIDNKEKENARNANYNKQNKDDLTSYRKRYRDENKKAISNYYKQYKIKNIDKIRKRNTEYSKIRKINDPVFKLRSCISVSIFLALKKNNSTKNGKSILQFLPYTIQELKEHLEKQFEPWMNWNNHGTYDSQKWIDNDQSTWAWQLDHIIPQSKLPYLSMEDDNFKKCWALENLRPYSAKQNIIDGVTKIRHEK